MTNKEAEAAVTDLYKRLLPERPGLRVTVQPWNSYEGYTVLADDGEVIRRLRTVEEVAEFADSPTGSCCWMARMGIIGLHMVGCHRHNPATCPTCQGG